jgi:hypothetical protein
MTNEETKVFVREALANGGYDHDGDEIVLAHWVGMSPNGNVIFQIYYKDDGEISDGFVYVQWDATSNKWKADY